MNFFLFEQEEEMPKSLLNEDGQLFAECKQCGKSLQEPPQNYTLEKVYKRYPNSSKPQVLFEYAVCDDCAGQIREEFSEESAAHLQQYFTEKAAAREVDFSENIDERLENCMLLNTPLAEEQEFVVVARGRGNNMLQSHYPFAISLTAMDEIAELLSDSTRDLLDDFVNQNFPGPPEFETVPVDGKWVLV